MSESSNSGPSTPPSPLPWTLVMRTQDGSTTESVLNHHFDTMSIGGEYSTIRVPNSQRLLASADPDDVAVFNHYNEMSQRLERDRNMMGDITRMMSGIREELREEFDRKLREEHDRQGQERQELQAEFEKRDLEQTRRYECLADSQSNQSKVMEVLMEDKKNITFNGCLVVIARLSCPKLDEQSFPQRRVIENFDKPPRARKAPTNALQMGMEKLVSSEEQKAVLAGFCSSRPGAGELYSVTNVTEFNKSITPLDRHGMAHPEANHIKIFSDLLSIISFFERSGGGPLGSYRLILKFLVCSMGPVHAAKVIAECVRKDDTFSVTYADLLEVCRPFL